MRISTEAMKLLSGQTKAIFIPFRRRFIYIICSHYVYNEKVYCKRKET